MRAVDPASFISTTRYLCQVDLFYFMRYVSLARHGMKWLAALDDPFKSEYRCFLDAPIVIRMARVMESLGNKTLLIGGRGLVKSTLHVGDVIRQILIDPQVKILCIASTKDLATRTVGKIMVEIDQNQFLRSLFPEIFWDNGRRDAKRAGVQWTSQSLTVKRHGGHKEGTVDAAGCLDGLPIGVHYHQIRGDDMEEPKNVTENVLPKLLAVLEHIPPLTTGHGAVWNTIGTFHHARGLHAEGLPEAGWNTIQIPSVDTSEVPKGFLEIPFGNSTRKVWWNEIGGTPIYDTGEFLADKLLTMKARSYASQYLCKKPNEIEKKLDEKLINWYYIDTKVAGHYMAFQMSSDVLKGCENVLLVDPAHNKSGGAKVADQTCMLVVGLYQSGSTKMVIIRDAYYSPFLSRPGRLYVAMKLIVKWGIRQVRWEAFGAVEDHLELPGYLKERGVDTRNFTVTPYTTKVKKEVRAIEILQPLLIQGQLYAPCYHVINKYPEPNEREGVPPVPEQELAALLKAEFRTYPEGGMHFIDTLGMVSEINAKAGRRRRPELQWGNENTTHERRIVEPPRLQIVRPALHFLT